jgi:hypothetical protein
MEYCSEFKQKHALEVQKEWVERGGEEEKTEGWRKWENDF